MDGFHFKSGSNTQTASKIVSDDKKEGIPYLKENFITYNHCFHYNIAIMNFLV